MIVLCQADLGVYTLVDFTCKINMVMTLKIDQI